MLATQTVNINTADAAQLASALSGIGEKKAQLIVAWRQEHGHFKTLNDLAKVKGLGPKLIERNKDIIVFSDSTKQNYLREKSDRDNSTLIWPTPSRAYWCCFVVRAYVRIAVRFGLVPRGTKQKTPPGQEWSNGICDVGAEVQLAQVVFILLGSRFVSSRDPNESLRYRNSRSHVS